MKDRDLFTLADPIDWAAEEKKLDGARKLARSSHPETSKAAARAVAGKVAMVQLEVLGMLAAHPGCTVSELAQRYGLRDPRHIGRRLPELVEAGKATRGQARLCRVTGHNATTWFRAD